MSRAGDRKRAEQFREFVRAFDQFIAAGLLVGKVRGEETEEAFRKARDRVVAARSKIVL